MRISSYTIGEPIPGQKFYLLLHGYSGAVDKVHFALGARLMQHRGECVSECNWFSELSPSTIATLEVRGYLTTDTADQEREIVRRIAQALHERDLEMSPTGFMLVPTYRCNLRCPYCFQSHDMHEGKGCFSAIMNREQVDSAFSIIDCYDRPGAVGRAVGRLTANVASAVGPPVRADYENRIGLFGGEPLARDSRPIVEYILQCARRRGKALSAVTNGVELHHFLDLLGPGRIEKLQITLDGDKDLHDRRRVGPGYHETFELILTNTQSALRSGVEVSVRINVDNQNPHAPAKLSKLFTERGWDKLPNFHAYAAAVHPPRPVRTPFSQLQLVQITMKPAEAEAPSTHSSCRIASYESTANDLLGRALGGSGYPFPRGVNCAAETGLLIFDPLGDVYSCWEDIGYSEYRIGSFDVEGLKLNQLADEWLNRFPGNIEECISCPYALIHTSGCAAHARKMNGSVMSPACESFKEYFPGTLSNVYARFERNLLEASQLTMA